LAIASNQTIMALDDIVVALPHEQRSLFERIFRVAVHYGTIVPPPEMRPWIEKQFGSVDATINQKIVRVTNLITLDGVLFNWLRSSRPVWKSEPFDIEAALAQDRADPLADPYTGTPADVFGRVRGRYCVTASNIAKFDGFHGLVVFDEPNPLHWDRDHLRDYLETAERWALEANRVDPAAKYYLFIWNCLWRAGASLLHGHAQVMLGRDMHYAGVESLRRAGLLETGALTVAGVTLGEQLDEWERCNRRARLRTLLRERDGVDPDDVIFSPDAAARRGITSTVCFPHGNLAPEGSIIKSTAIDPEVIGPDGVYRMTGPARVFVREPDAIAYIKSDRIRPGDVLVLACRGPMGAGMEETYQLTAALKYLSFGKHVALLTDARFSGISTGACIGHVSPEALAGGPIGKLRDGDLIEIVVDRVNLEGSVNFVGESGANIGAEAGARVLAARPPRPDLAPDPALPDDTRLWAALQDASGGPWGGSVFDAEAILRVLALGKAALAAGGVSGEHS